VREFKLKKWVAAGLIVSMPYAGIVDAAGLGGMNVLSQLGQPFSAEINLVNVSQEELATLSARLATPEAYRSANLQFNPALINMRLVIERRADGKPFIRATSTRPIAEPFLDILIELSWQGGRIVREYSALLDPPGLDLPTPAAPVVATAKPAPAAKSPVAVEAPATAPAAPSVKPAPAAKTAPASVAPVAATRPIGGSEYAVKQGDTLWQIATGMRPEGISLDQMMIGLLRANSDAFINNNINLVKAGKILKVPERDQLAAITQGDATQEVRVHATNWNAYRQKAAAAAPTATEAAPATKGKITARVEDKAAATGSKDVVVLSKGDGATGKGKDGKAGADRVRALEEDLTARDKALAEAKERVALLEKTIKDMQKLAEIKSPAMAAAQQAGKGDAKAPAAPVKAEPPKVEAPKSDAPKPAAKEAVAEVAKVEPTPKAAPPVPKKAPAVAPPPPPPEPGIMDTVMDNLLPIGGGGAALLAGLAGFWAVRRRRKGEKAEDEGSDFTRTAAIPRSTVAAPVASAAAVAAAPVPAESTVSDVVDPIEEAQVYIDHGRDNQAEDILKEAMGKEPRRQDVQLKLLEIYATRGDTGSFNTLAKDFNVLTGGVGENWDKATAMGHAIDPSNALYPATGEVFDIGGGDTPAPTVDLDIGTEDNLTTTNTDILLIGAEDDSNTSTDILLDMGSPGAGADSTVTMAQQDLQPAAQPALPEFNLDLPAASPQPEVAVNPNLMDFNLDLPQVEAAAEARAPAALPADKPADDGGLDFKVDFSGIDLNLDDKPAATGGGEKDAHWNDVQQKFDLARAYQDMGDKDGAREILREVEREGDAAQKAEAQKLLESIK
jgi:pilus assembly protein FimV